MRYASRRALRGYAVIAIALIAMLLGAPDAGARPKPKPAPRCQMMTEPVAKTLFDDWNKALQAPGHDPTKVVELYTPNAVLLPTKENGPYIGRPEIRRYFEKFLLDDPVGKIDSRAIVRAPCNIGVVAGLYTFTLSSGTVPARYTYVYIYQDGHWLISHHHSSAQPKK